MTQHGQFPLLLMIPLALRGKRIFDKGMDIHEGVRKIRQTDRRYDAQAYHFIRDVLDFTFEHVRLPERRHSNSSSSRHVHGSEILEGFRQLVLREFGPMALLVVQTWGVECCRDVGNVVYNLINAGVFTKSEEESVEDFQETYVFAEVFDYHRKRISHEV